jgi:hypothetical protein
MNQTNTDPVGQKVTPISDFGKFNIIFEIAFLFMESIERSAHRDSVRRGAKSWICQSEAYKLTNRRIF